VTRLKEYLFDGNGKSIIDLDNDFMELDPHELKSCDRAIQGIDTVFHLADVVAGITFVFDNQPFVYRSNAMINSNNFLLSRISKSKD
jgi:GDP-D-mannose 3', 5'-epimerase